MKRRTVLHSMLAAATLAGSLASGVAARAKGTVPKQIIKPARLHNGMTVGLIAPASNTAENEGIRFAIDIVRSLGFKVKEGQFLFSRNQYLAGTDSERAVDVNQMFADPAVDAIFCLRGGYGTPRILPLLDYELVRENPKVIMGFSDITALLNAIHVRTGMVTFHGQVAQQSYSDYTLAELKKVLFAPAQNTIIAAPPPFEVSEGRVEDDNRLTTFVGGKARGRLIGGNLTLLTRLIGTPYEPDYHDSILFLEEIGEAPYRIDGMLTQLWLAGRLQQVAGIAFGKLSRTESNSGNTFSIEEVIEQRCVPLNVPVIRGLMIGHTRNQTVVPIGIRAELDADAGTITLLEPAVD